MAQTTRTYSISLDMPGGTLNNSGKLQSELAAPGNGVSTKVDGISTSGDALNIVFDAALSASEIMALDGGTGLPYGTHPAGGLLAAHDDTPSPPVAQPVTVDNDPGVVVQQQSKSNGHYRAVPLLLLGIAPGATQYSEIVVQDYPKGMDWHNAHFYAGDSDSGDVIAGAKMLVGKISVLAAAAASGDTVVVVAGPAGVLKTMALGGALDEGFYLSFGTEQSTAAVINAANPPGTGTLSNPQGELTEYEIYSFGAQTPIGGGNVIVQITLLTALVADLTQGMDVNLVVRGIPEPIPITKGDTINIGGDVLTAGNMPAGSKLRYGYQNNGPGVKNIRGVLTALY